MQTKRLTITKTPQCRHAYRFLVFVQVGALWKVTCSNCASTTVAAYIEQEDARNALMRIEAPPIAEP